MSKRNLLISGMTNGTGGIEVFFKEHMPYIIKDYNVYIIKYGKSIAFEDYFLKLGCKVKKMTPRRVSYRKSITDVDDLLSEVDIDILWMNKVSLSNIDLLKQSKFKIRTRIVHIHNSKNKSSKLSALLHKINKKNIGKFANHFWGSSKEALYYAFPKKLLSESKVINNAINLEKFEFNEESRDKIRLDLKLTDSLVYISVSRLSIEKNLMLMLELFKEISMNDRKAKLLILGDGSERLKMETYVKTHDLIDKVIFLGTKTNTSDYLSAADYFISTSLSEGFGISLLEAEVNHLPSIIINKAYPVEVMVSNNILELNNGKTSEMVKSINQFTQNNSRKQSILSEKVKDYATKENYQRIQMLLSQDKSKVIVPLNIKEGKDS